MIVRIVSSGADTVTVDADGRQQDLPVSWFPQVPKAGQTWDGEFRQILNDKDKLDLINNYLGTE